MRNRNYFDKPLQGSRDADFYGHTGPIQPLPIYGYHVSLWNWAAMGLIVGIVTVVLIAAGSR